MRNVKYLVDLNTLTHSIVQVQVQVQVYLYSIFNMVYIDTMCFECEDTPVQYHLNVK